MVYRGEILRSGGIPLAAFILPASWKVLYAQARLERRFAALQCIEAMRLHAATHGKLPGTLKEITDHPLPLDPIHGQGFVYSVKGSEARLFGLPPEGERLRSDNVVQLQLSLRLPKK
jgi:hypothetical protein